MVGYVNELVATNDKQEFDGLVSTHLLGLSQTAISDNKMVGVTRGPGWGLTG